MNGRTAEDILEEKDIENTKANLWIMKKVFLGKVLTGEEVEKKLKQDFGIKPKEVEKIIGKFVEKEIVITKEFPKNISYFPNKKTLPELV